MELALLLKIVVEIFVFLFYCITYLTNNDLSVSLCKFGFGGVGNIKKRGSGRVGIWAVLVKGKRRRKRSIEILIVTLKQGWFLSLCASNY